MRNFDPKKLGDYLEQHKHLLGLWNITALMSLWMLNPLLKVFGRQGIQWIEYESPLWRGKSRYACFSPESVVQMFRRRCTC